MQNFIYLLFAIIFLFQFGFSNCSDFYIDPPGQQHNSSIYIAKSGNDKFIISCVYNGDDADGSHAIQWINELGKVINPSKSVITFSNKNEKKLVFVNIKQRDTGEYKCRVQLKNDQFLEKKIFIKVINNVEWNVHNNIVGGNINDSLTIDCGAKSDTEPLIEIADANGRSVEEKGFNVINNQVTIKKLTKEHNNLVFKCIAIQKIHIIDKFNATITDEHILTVNVYYPPEFGMSEIETYTTSGKNVSLNCFVGQSNPNVERFNFFKGDQIIFNHDRYDVSSNLGIPMATLTINSVEDEDYGRYYCVAHNSKLSSKQIFVLKKTSPPKQPTVKIVEIYNNSIVLRITENRAPEDDLPVLTYSVSYKLTNRATRQELSDEATKFGGRRTKTFSKDINNLYEIKGLEPYVEYEILVSLSNEVGESDPALIHVVTGFNNKSVYSSANNSQFSLFSVFIGLIILILGIFVI